VFKGIQQQGVAFGWDEDDVPVLKVPADAQR
jgi:hypothetical protein